MGKGNHRARSENTVMWMRLCALCKKLMLKPDLKPLGTVPVRVGLVVGSEIVVLCTIRVGPLRMGR
jgi:hypothetical protein